MKIQIVINKICDDDGKNARAMISIQGHMAQVSAHIHVPLSAIAEMAEAARKLVDMPFPEGGTMARVVVEADDEK